MIILEVGLCSGFIRRRLIGYRPHDHRWPILVTTNKLSHYFQVMLKGIVPKVLSATKQECNTASSFTLKSTHECKKATFKQESTIHSCHVEFDEWREHCVRRRSPRSSFTFSAIIAIAAIMWKPQVATIAELYFSAIAAIIAIVAIIWKPALGGLSQLGFQWFFHVLKTWRRDLYFCGVIQAA